MQAKLPIDVFHHNVRAYPFRPAFRRKVGSDWDVISWSEYGEWVRNLGLGMIALGHEAGRAVTILGFNSVEWVVACVASMAIGGTPAGIYTTCTPEQVAYIVEHSESPICFVEDEHQLEKLRAKKDELPNLRCVVVWKAIEGEREEWVKTFDEVIALGAEQDRAAYDERAAAIRPDDIGTLIYTSGTTGPPKAVMLSHQALYFTGRVVVEMLDIRGPQRIISFLPLSHIAEQMITVHGSLHHAGEAWFAQSIEALPDNLKDARPTLFFAVPRLWEKFKAGIEAKVKEAPTARQKIFAVALAVGRRAGRHLIEHGRFESPLHEAAFKLFDKLVYAKLKANLGFDCVTYCYTGAAPISAEVLDFFNALNIPLMELYGQSEDCGPTTANLPGATRVGSVGRAIPGVEVKIADDGEILVRGQNVFAGYFKNPESTAETLIDGWLHSGDVGVIDEAGFLRITDRKKDLIITAGGKNVAPQNIEKLLKDHPLLSQAVVIGDRHKYLTALLTLDGEALKSFAKTHGVPQSPDEASKSRVVKETIQSHIDQVNAVLARYETIKKFTVLPADFSTDGGELTPTLKVKRKVVNEKYAEQIAAMYPAESS
ncbi:MAG: long-chain fatty acid--CoA ligase [Myxococcales bacterium]|nr:long-chain fatty acid--CoA ligase [Myxococcales bacterium]